MSLAESIRYLIDSGFDKDLVWNAVSRNPSNYLAV